MRTLTVALLAITLLTLVATGAGSTPSAFPGRNGRVVFASVRPIPGQPGANFRNGEIYSLDLASGRTRDLSRSPGDERAPALSPDGTRIAFARSSLAGRGLWLMRRDGRAQRRLAELDVTTRDGNIGEQAITWSPDGRKIAFLVGPWGSSSLWVINADGSSLRRLTDFYADTPRWSPDGGRIAFARGKFDWGEHRAHRSALYLMDADGRDVRRLTSGGPGGPDTSPSWAPSGRRIVFARDDVVSLLDLGTGRVHTLAYGVDPAWSPNGQLIAVAAGTKLEAVRPDGRGARTLFDGGAKEDGRVPAQISHPSWSPDGRWIAFHLLYDNDGHGQEESQLIVSRTGRRRGTPTFACDLPQPPFEPEAGSVTVWSPDGRWVAVGGVFICPVNGSAGHWLTPGVDPDWQSRKPR